PQLDDFEGNPPPDGFLLFGHIDHPAATFADLLEELVVADLVTGLLGDNADRRPRLGLFGQKAFGRFVGVKEGLDSGEQCRVLAAGTLEVAEPAFGGRNVQRGFEDFPLAVAVVGRRHRATCCFYLTMRRSRPVWAKNLSVSKSSLQLLVKPGARVSPSALGGALRQTQQPRGFDVWQA